MARLEIKLDKFDRCFYFGDTVTGVVVVSCASKTAHNGIKLSVEGQTCLKLSVRNMSVYESFSASMKPIALLSHEIDIARPGRFAKGQVLELPFEFTLEAERMYETYHGVYINTQFIISVEMLRSFPSKNVSKSMEFIVKSSTGKKGWKAPKPKKKKKTAATSEEKSSDGGDLTSDKSMTRTVVPFHITAESIKNMPKKASKRSALPKFEISGAFQSGVCNVEEPFVGELTVEASDSEIASIELQFVRVETCIEPSSKAEIREATEVQNIQLADGDVVRGVPIPIYMIFPRLFTCISTNAVAFKVEFEMNVVVLFKDSYMITENYPITLIRRHTRKFF